MCVATKHKFKWNKQQWEEIEALAFEGFEPQESMVRSQWMAVAHMALGKAQRIENGDYGSPEDDMEDNEEWAEEMREIARVILDEFQPGDGNL